MDLEYDFTDIERFDIFSEFLTTKEWTKPVKEFIDYYCIIFSSGDMQEYIDEKE